MCKEILKLKDVKLIDIKTDNDIYHGCETCGYGSYYCEEIKFIFDNNKKLTLTINEERGDESLFSYGDLIRIFTNHCDEIKELTFDTFGDYIVQRVKEVLDIEEPTDYYRNDLTVEIQNY